MAFLQAEVENEERIAMAVSGFGLKQEQSALKKKRKADSNNEIATASALLATKESKVLECIFCNEKHDRHGRRFCRYNMKCAWCSKRHVLLMCRGITAERSTKKNPTEKPTIKQKESSLANLSLAKELDCEEIGQYNIVHLLFGGVKTKPQQHKGYRIRLSSLDGSYACNFVALGQETICQDIPASYKKLNVEQQQSKLVLDGPSWRLDVLGITDPVQTKTKEAHLEQVKDYFRQTVTVNNSGRYEVFLPWKENHPPLSDNKKMAIKRLEINTRRLKSDNLFEDYCRVLEEWTAEGIIEQVPLPEVNDSGYYLPHRHVLKENSTTRLRPVFDALARGIDSPSLNQCLEVGSNLIELIPTMLLRFRERRIGVISDIKRAFLQISVSPKERNVLRFLWWSKEDPTKITVYRHCRVVFGVSSSHFLLGATIELLLERALQQATRDEQRAIIRKLQKSFYVDNCVTSVDSNEELQLFMEGATDAMSAGGFLLRGWEYSDPTLIRDSSSLLGLTWNRGQDTLSLTKTALEEPLPEKKLWSTDLDWDTEVNKEIEDIF
ncbi:uncharacterized protein LOC143898261 [Temnothorax americanus]|uniref:uncharacterized protein LOC143898261 n=1 Tax=Temnothorax americanus TaxID=1964332 RepID=UPI0040685498